jgi:hypothetical protein
MLPAMYLGHSEFTFWRFVTHIQLLAMPRCTGQMYVKQLPELSNCPKCLPQEALKGILKALIGHVE